MTRIRTWVFTATMWSTNHYTIMAASEPVKQMFSDSVETVDAT